MAASITLRWIGFLGAFWLATPACVAKTIEPRRIQRPAELRAGEGALLLSIRHQTPVAQTMHVRFVAVDDPGRELKFERKVGLGGRTRMLERQTYVYAVPAGRWRLSSHLAGCDESIQPGEECVLTIAGNSFELPSGTYPADWFVVEVPERGLTVADELNLELPRDTRFDLPADAVTREVQRERVRALRFKHRAIPMEQKQVVQPFLALTRGTVIAAAEARSATTCERPAKELGLYYNPFAC